MSTASQPLQPAPARTRSFEPFRPLLSGFFGILAPIVCLLVMAFGDPLIAEIPGLAFFNRYPIFNYSFVAISIFVLLIWLKMGIRIGCYSGLLAGAMLIGAAYSGLLGVVLFPMSVVGLMVAIGAFGFTPLFTSYVFYRNAERACHLAQARLGYRRFVGTLFVGAVLAFSIPCLVEVYATRSLNHAVESITSGQPVAKAIPLRLIAPIYHNAFIAAYQRETNHDRQSQIAAAYREIFHRSIEEWIRWLND